MAELTKNGDTVRVHYTGRLEDGQVFDSSEGGEPLEFTVGAGDVLPGFEEAVRGMHVGDRRTFDIEPEDGYGEYHEERVRTLPRDGINLDAEPQVGMILALSLPDGTQLPIEITEVTDTHVTLDANHPLAGRKLTFDVTLVENRSGG